MDDFIREMEGSTRRILRANNLRRKGGKVVIDKNELEDKKKNVNLNLGEKKARKKDTASIGSMPNGVKEDDIVDSCFAKKDNDKLTVNKMKKHNYCSSRKVRLNEEHHNIFKNQNHTTATYTVSKGHRSNINICNSTAIKDIENIDENYHVSHEEKTNVSAGKMCRYPGLRMIEGRRNEGGTSRTIVGTTPRIHHTLRKSPFYAMSPLSPSSCSSLPVTGNQKSMDKHRAEVEDSRRSNVYNKHDYLIKKKCNANYYQKYPMTDSIIEDPILTRKKWISATKRWQCTNLNGLGNSNIIRPTHLRDITISSEFLREKYRKWRGWNPNINGVDDAGNNNYANNDEDTTFVDHTEALVNVIVDYKSKNNEGDGGIGIRKGLPHNPNGTRRYSACNKREHSYHHHSNHCYQHNRHPFIDMIKRHVEIEITKTRTRIAEDQESYCTKRMDDLGAELITLVNSCAVTINTATIDLKKDEPDKIKEAKYLRDTIKKVDCDKALPCSGIICSDDGNQHNLSSVDCGDNDKRCDDEKEIFERKIDNITNCSYPLFREKEKKEKENELIRQSAQRLYNVPPLQSWPLMCCEDYPGGESEVGIKCQGENDGINYGKINTNKMTQISIHRIVGWSKKCQKWRFRYPKAKSTEKKNEMIKTENFWHIKSFNSWNKVAKETIIYEDEIDDLLLSLSNNNNNNSKICVDPNKSSSSSHYPLDITNKNSQISDCDGKLVHVQMAEELMIKEAFKETNMRFIVKASVWVDTSSGPIPIITIRLSHHYYCRSINDNKKGSVIENGEELETETKNIAVVRMLSHDVMALLGMHHVCQALRHSFWMSVSGTKETMCIPETKLTNGKLIWIPLLERLDETRKYQWRTKINSIIRKESPFSDTFARPENTEDTLDDDNTTQYVWEQPSSPFLWQSSSPSSDNEYYTAIDRAYKLFFSLKEIENKNEKNNDNDCAFLKAIQSHRTRNARANDDDLLLSSDRARILNCLANNLRDIPTLSLRLAAGTDKLSLLLLRGDRLSTDCFSVGKISSSPIFPTNDEDYKQSNNENSELIDIRGEERKKGSCIVWFNNTEPYHSALVAARFTSSEEDGQKGCESSRSLSLSKKVTATIALEYPATAPLYHATDFTNYLPSPTQHDLYNGPIPRTMAPSATSLLTSPLKSYIDNRKVPSILILNQNAVMTDWSLLSSSSSAENMEGRVCNVVNDISHRRNSATLTEYGFRVKIFAPLYELESTLQSSVYGITKNGATPNRTRVNLRHSDAGSSSSKLKKTCAITTDLSRVRTVEDFHYILQHEDTGKDGGSPSTPMLSTLLMSSYKIKSICYLKLDVYNEIQSKNTILQRAKNQRDFLLHKMSGANELLERKKVKEMEKILVEEGVDYATIITCDNRNSDNAMNGVYEKKENTFDEKIYASLSPKLNKHKYSRISEDVVLSSKGRNWRKLPKTGLSKDIFQLNKQKYHTCRGDHLFDMCNVGKVVGMVDPAKEIDYKISDMLFQTKFESRFISDVKCDRIKIANSRKKQEKCRDIILNSKQNEALEHILQVPLDIKTNAFFVKENEVRNDDLVKDGGIFRNELPFELSNSSQSRVKEVEVESRALLAVKNTNYKVIGELLDDLGVAVDIRDSFGNTLLILACQQGSKKMVKFLLRRGANINAQNHMGNTILFYLHEYGHLELAKYLLRKGADDSILNRDGLTCYEGVKKNSDDLLLL